MQTRLSREYHPAQRAAGKRSAEIARGNDTDKPDPKLNDERFINPRLNSKRRMHGLRILTGQCSAYLGDSEEVARVQTYQTE